ncbi:N-alpha-acetyltransferase 25, NatB auxiliary subunit [Entophlyctis luteolus]|nr:N-alpha-acetyltransferase 25, NatB auxiliary subunit [Entophlyctis luteolus]
MREINLDGKGKGQANGAFLKSAMRAVADSGAGAAKAAAGGGDASESADDGPAADRVRLSIANCGLTALDGVASEKIVHLVVADNRLTGLPASFAKDFPSLVTLDIANNRIASLDPVLEALKPLAATLRHVVFEMNPCAAKQQYRDKVFEALPSIISVDGLDRNGGEVEEDEDDEDEDDDVDEEDEYEDEDEDFDDEVDEVDEEDDLPAAKSTKGKNAQGGGARKTGRVDADVDGDDAENGTDEGQEDEDEDADEDDDEDDDDGDDDDDDENERFDAMNAHSELVQILDAIDSGKYKTAAALASKGLKRNKQSVVLKAVLAYANDRLGNSASALSLCTELLSVKPPVSDDLSLQLISQVLRFNKRSNDIVALYANAYAAQPANEELANQHFMALARVGTDLKAMQQTALKMQKQFKDQKYFFWAVCVIYLQGLASADNGGASKTTSNVYFSLAEKMLQKAKDENKISSFEELLLFVMVLDAQQKYSACVGLLSTELAVRVCKVESELRALVLKYMHLAQQTDSVLSLCREGLDTTPDDWRIYVTYVDALHSLIVVEQGVEDVKDAPEFNDALLFVRNIQATNNLLKSPFLFEVELFSKFNLFEGTYSWKIPLEEINLPAEEMNVSIVKYFEKFGKTISFFEDIRRYLNLVQDSSHLGLLFGLNQEIEKIASDCDALVLVRMRINFYKVKYSITPKFSAEDQEGFCNLLLKEYSSALELGLNATERQYGDDCLVMVACLAVDLFTQSRDLGLLYLSVYLLEIGLRKSPHNFQMRIMLIRLYAYLGVSQPVVTHSLSLDVKQVLLDTLTYLYADDFERYAPLPIASQVVRKALSIYNSNDKETPEMIIQAYKFKTYSKVPEFCDFQRRLASSIQLAVSNRQAALTEILSLSTPSKFKALSDYLGDLDGSNLALTVEIDKMSDNRDRTMNVSWKVGKGKSFFEAVSGGEIPADRRTWIRVYGAIPLVVKAWVSGESVDGNVLKLLDGVSEEHEFTASIVRDLNAGIKKGLVLCVSSLAAVVAKLKGRLSSVKKTVVAVDSFKACESVHTAFEAISYARIASESLKSSGKADEKAVAKFHVDVYDLCEAFASFVGALQNGVREAAQGAVKCIVNVEGCRAIAGFVCNSDVVERVHDAVNASYLEFLESLANQIVAA